VNIYYVAAIWLGMALLASVVSIRIAVPAALVEIVVGALAGNIPGIREHVTQTAVITFLAAAGSLVLTFLAGAEIDPVSLRGHWKASVSIGTELVTVVILSAFMPTLIAQQLFQPAVVDTEEEEALGEKDLSIIHHGSHGDSHPH
jgi:Kef-type K+ transport system membrane component KefB